MEYGIYRRWIYHLRTVGTKLHALDKRHVRHEHGIIDDARVCRQETVNIGPYLKHFGINRSGNERGCEVAPRVRDS